MYLVALHCVLNPKVLLCVYWCHWAKEGGLELKVLNQCTLILYFEEARDLEMVLHHAPWDFENGPLVFKQMLHNISPFALKFEATPLFI